MRLKFGLSFLILLGVSGTAYPVPITNPATSSSASLLSLSPNKLTELQSALDEWRQSYGLPGASMSLSIPGLDNPVNLVSGVAKINQRNVTPDTLFQMDSITKVYTAALILKLEAERKLSIYQRLYLWLPEYPNWGNITIQQLLNMTSGIPNFTDDDQFNQARRKDPTKTWTPVEELNFVKDKSLFYVPGTGWNYDDTNYLLLGLIIEKATGKSYGEVLNHEILKPLALSHTYYVPYAYSPALLQKLATGYSEDGKDVMNINMSQAGPAGAIIATTEDTALFFHDLFSGRVLPKQQLMEMKTPYSLTTGRSLLGRPLFPFHSASYSPHSSDESSERAFGLGLNWWATPVGHMWFKPGGFEGFLSMASVLDKNQRVVVIAANQFSQTAFMGLPREFVPKIYEIIG
jgi:D-alanyl-D-alanine carboxypeptidase